MVIEAEEDVPTGVTAMRDDDSTPEPAALVGRSIAGKFVIEALIASGGAGSVYRARQLALDRIVALKVLRQDIARDRHFVERFKREARAASRLDHPNSVRVFDFGHVDDSLLYLAMELVEGRSLHNVIQDEWPLGDRRVVAIMSQVLSAIAVAHEMEVIHRDLKPDNIMIISATSDDGEATEVAKVCDFGIATLGAIQRDRAGDQAGGPWVTMDGSLVGTPGYMSPEQARGEQADRRSDIYSAGVILYHLLAGRPPFDGDSAYFVAMKHITDTPVPPSAHATVGPALEAICLRALSKSPGDRFDSAREMRSALRAALVAEEPRAARPAAPFDATPPPRPAARDTLELMDGAGIGASTRRRRTVAAVAGLAAAAMIVAGALAAKSRPRGGREPAPSTAAVATAAAPSPPVPAPPAAAAAPPSRGTAEAPPPAAAAGGAPVRPAPTERPARVQPTRDRDRGLVRAAAVAAKAAPGSPSDVGPATAPLPEVAAAPPPAPAPAARTAAPPAAAATTPPPPPPPPAPRIDIERATASVIGITTTSAIPGSNIRAALSRVPLARCYRDALRGGGLASGPATLHLRIDGVGYVVGAALSGAAITPALKGCIEKAATAMRIKDVDTGDATADVTLSFIAAP
jgi:serine/threonine-protein kinase